MQSGLRYRRALTFQTFPRECRADSTEYTCHRLSHLPPQHPPSVYPFIQPLLASLHLRRCRGLGGDSVGLSQVLQFALLAVLPYVNFCERSRVSLCTYVPLGKPDLALASALGSDSLILLERTTHDAGCNRNVAVVTVQGVRFNCGCLGARRGRMAYERPAAFHANAIVMVECVVSEVVVVGGSSLWL